MIESLNQWQFYNPVKLYAGRGSRKQLVEQLKNQKLLIVTTVRGKAQFLEDSILSEVVKNNQVTWVDSVKENPGLTDLQAEIDQLSNLKVDAIIAFGGGSAMDAAKALRIGLAVQGKYSLAELLENPALHKEAKQVPLYALPTTSGTGSEVTPFATVWHHEIHKKLSLASDNIFPSVAIVDAELTDSLPTKVTLSTGLDAINQAAESVWNKNANSITLALATRSLKLGLKALPLLIEGKGSEQERDQMAEASLLAGLAISHTRTALCHSISYPLTAHFGVPHGLACALTMPEVCQINLAVDDGRFVALAQALTGQSDVGLLFNVFLELNNQLNVAEQVHAYIPKLDDLINLQSEMYNPSRAANNLAAITDSDLRRILKKSFDISNKD
ncbi:phosphonoacetaldehyde reductase [Pseudomonas sp. C27(2019)]|uniref:phosphonoacetaldehyde reductase n=1 Tax=Pseudomonas sp. C27(2019) TaxID=2604941 RepID=UPI001243ED6E|nr:phosphonoacetaldehyde reductase [Pseudomonas sp. C27(2019)]QEY59412.1 phosphonoacetaldehyde reductase [Pseudomonas sp. C27(2019)]